MSKDSRLSKILHGGLSGLVGRGAALIVSAITLPLLVRYLGSLEYGIWVTISTSVAMLSVLDLGIANTLTNFISKAYAEDDPALAQKYFSTAFWLTGVVVLGFAIIAFFAWSATNWASVFNIPDPHLLAQARLCVWISIVYFLMSLPLGLVNRVLSGYQQIHLSNYFALINNFLSLVAIVSVVAMKGSLVVLMATFCCSLLVGTLILNIWLLFWYKPFLKPWPGLADAKLARVFLGEGSLFFILQLCTLIVFNSDNLVIMHYLGASEVTPYSITWRLTSYATMMQSLLIPSLWPAFTEAYHRRDMQWVRTAYRNALRASLLGVGVIALGIGMLGRVVIRFWAGDQAVPSVSLVWCMAFWAFLVSFTTNQALLLTAVGRLKIEAVVAVLAAILNLFLSIHLVKSIGSLGVILSTVISFLVCMVGPQEWAVRRVLAGTYLPDAGVEMERPVR